MRTTLIFAALGVALATTAAAQTKAPPPARPSDVPRAPVKPALPPKPAEMPSDLELLRMKLDAMGDGPMIAPDLAPAMEELHFTLQDKLAGVGPALMDAQPALANIGPMMADLAPAMDVGPMLADVGPMMADLAPVLAGFGPAKDATGGWRGARSIEGLADLPLAPWLPADQADSTYREARDALNREQYQHASDLFRQIWSRMPKSGYAPDALYWNAFALYRQGGDSQLREALGLLDRQAKDYPKAGTRESAATLATRIRGQLAQGGDASAQRDIRSKAESTAACENDDVRIAAINALSQMDADRALPIVKKVLAKRDECSAPLREKAVYVLTQQHAADADAILLDVVKNDPSPRVKRQAVYYLGQTRSDQAIAALEDLLKTSDDRQIQEAALYALAENAGDRAGDILRRVAENESMSESVRGKAIYYLKDRRGADNAAYLRALYPKLTSTKLREQLLYTLGEMGGPDNVRWLTGIVMDTTATSRERAAALYRIAESQGSTADLSALFDRLHGREVRDQALYYLSQRRDAAATAKLVDVLKTDPERSTRDKALYFLSQRDDAGALDQVIAVAKSDPDREMRRKAIYYLGQSKDPRAMKALEEIIGQ